MTMVESRRAERVRSFLRARIVFNNQNSTIDCTVKNISQTGAKIEIANSLSVPAEFDLDVPQRGKVYRAKIVWRDADSMGVTFAADEQKAAWEVPDAQLKRLERENHRLRTHIAELIKRLEDIGQAVDRIF